MTNPSLNQVTVLDLVGEIIGRAKAQEDLEAVEETEEAVVEEVMEETFKVILREGQVAVEEMEEVVEEEVMEEIFKVILQEDLVAVEVDLAVAGIISMVEIISTHLAVLLVIGITTKDLVETVGLRWTHNP